MSQNASLSLSDAYQYLTGAVCVLSSILFSSESEETDEISDKSYKLAMQQRLDNGSIRRQHI